MNRLVFLVIVFSLWLVSAVPAQAANATRNTDMKMVINPPPARPSVLLPTLVSPIAIKLALNHAAGDF